MTPAGTSNELDVQNGWEENTHTHTQQNVLVDCCCFHLTSGASTAVGPYFIPRNRKGFFLSQSTLREKFAEKKFQVFDIVGPLIILVQVNLSSPVERV